MLKQTIFVVSTVLYCFTVLEGIILSPFNNALPLVITTWPYQDAVKEGWNTIDAVGKTALDAVEATGHVCEMTQCRHSVGYGSRPDESGETTLDAMIMDGTTHNVGAVGGLRRIKQAISVARKVLEYTDHTLLVGDAATKFAVELGFKEENLTTEYSVKLWEAWKNASCQPNSRKNVLPDPLTSCGPYHPVKFPNTSSVFDDARQMIGKNNHDTIGIIAIDEQGHIASGASTNGLKHKVPGRVGDTPIAGAGSYADGDIGAAACTGNGDLMMRFLPSYHAVMLMGTGLSPTDAATSAINAIRRKYPTFTGAVVAANKQGEYGAACHVWTNFAITVKTRLLPDVTVFNITCSHLNGTPTSDLPLVLVTWPNQDAVKAGWKMITSVGNTAVDAVEATGNSCEMSQCKHTVGFGGSPDENGETTLDAIIMDGTTHNVGAVGGLRRIKQAISVARKVMDNTDHSLLVGDAATNFAVEMGFIEENLTTSFSEQLWEGWKNAGCQPNFRETVFPDPHMSCGPYHPDSASSISTVINVTQHAIGENNHDTIGIIAIDSHGKVASGASTNGLTFKVPGRVGDTSIAGAGSYADGDIGAAACTGNGDIMMRFLPSYHAVTLMGTGVSPTDAAASSIEAVRRKNPAFEGAVVAVNKKAEYGAACHGWTMFGFTVQTTALPDATVYNITCTQ